MSLINFSEISFGYNKQKDLFSNINFSIEEGECVGLIGPSGCGKSTLAQIIAGHIRPSAGKITVCETNRTFKPSRDIVLLHQESDLFPWQNVTQQIEFAFQGRPRKEIETQTQKWISLVKLVGYEKYYPNELSVGMKKRLSLARALAIKPKLLILDETLSSLDQELKLNLINDLKCIWKKTNVAIMLITHSADDLKIFGDVRTISI